MREYCEKNVQKSNRDCCRDLFYLCKQALITYDAEPKICDMKTRRGRPLVARLPPPSSDGCRSRKTAEKTSTNPKKKGKRAALTVSSVTSGSLVVGSVLVLRYPVQLFHLLHMPLILRGYLAATATIRSRWLYWEGSVETGKAPLVRLGGVSGDWEGSTWLIQTNLSCPDMEYLKD